MKCRAVTRAGAKCRRSSGPGNDAFCHLHREKENCAICLDQITAASRQQTTTACGHRFHTKCLGEWARDENTCPLCRASLRDNPSAGPYAGAEAEELRAQGFRLIDDDEMRAMLSDLADPQSTRSGSVWFGVIDTPAGHYRHHIDRPGPTPDPQRSSTQALIQRLEDDPLMALARLASSS